MVLCPYGLSQSFANNKLEWKVIRCKYVHAVNTTRFMYLAKSIVYV